MDNACPNCDTEARIQVAPSGLRSHHLIKQRTRLGRREGLMPYHQHHSVP
jgi:hypothetical protein